MSSNILPSIFSELMVWSKILNAKKVFIFALSGHTDRLSVVMGNGFCRRMTVIRAHIIAKTAPFFLNKL